MGSGIPIYLKKKTEEGMVDSQPMEEEIQGTDARGVGTKIHRGPTEPVLEAKSQRTPSKNKEPAQTLNITKKKAKREKSTSRGKRSRYQETSSDSEHEEGSEDTYEDLNSPYKRPKPTPFTQRITRFRYHRSAKLPRNITMYEGNKDSEYHLGIFLAATEQEEWLMPVWCKMFRQTLGGEVRNWFDDLDPKSVESFEELSQKFLEEFLQQNRYAKDPTEIHGIKRRQNEGLQNFMDRFKFESSHTKRVPSVLRISAFMHGHGHPKLAKTFNDKILKIVDEMFERVRAFIRREVAACSAEMVRMYTLYPRRDTFTPHTKTSKEILAMESISFPKPPPLIGTLKKHNLNKFCDYHRDRSHNTNDCYQLKKHIEEVVASIKLTHLVKDICRNNQRNGGQGRSNIKFINMIRGGRSQKRPFKEERFGLTEELTIPVIPQGHLTIGPIILEGMIEGIVDLCVTIREVGNNKTVSMEFAIVKCRSPYNVIIGRTRMRSLRAVGSTIHFMIKFPTTQGIVTMKTSREALWECRQLDRMQNTLKETQWRQQEEQMSRIKVHVMIQTKNSFGVTLPVDYKRRLMDVLQENIDVFAWSRSKGTDIPRFVMEHRLKIYHLAEPIVHKRRPMTPDGRQALKEKVFHWLKEGIIRKVSHPEWVANAIPIRLASGAWKVQVDYFILNKVCAKDIYPFPKEGKGLASLMEYPYKCFLEGIQMPISYVSIPLQGMDVSYTLMENTILASIYLARSLRTIFRKHKIKVIIEGPMEEILKLFEGRGRLAKWATEIRTYDISYVSRKESEGPLVKKFLGQGEHGLGTTGASREETITVGKELEPNLTPTPKAW
uniref:Retrotransposon gag domain-containing protein n=1 Tax=Tanacetum cinerariifolium TaxID=118510 RepID=A0A699GMH5_TANCI|nr:hypothetical protein [Tanacetum cinerariifolium]